MKHQGRHLMEEAFKAAGLWILGGKSLINSILHKCITCHKLSRKLEEQHMADLPSESLKICHPFKYVGLDVFGPWSVTSTRGGQAESKQWAIMFCFMSSRAVHMKVIESMNASGCINALRLFFPCETVQFHQGLERTKWCKGTSMNKDAAGNSTPPHSSHMGGSWERLIGIARRILDSMFLHLKSCLIHKVLYRLMAVVTLIINAQPLLKEISRTKTCTQSKRNKFRLLQTSSGPTGDATTYLACNTDKSVQYLTVTFNWEI